MTLTLKVDDVLAQFGGGEIFSAYVDLLLSENERINLVSRETSREGLLEFVADSLTPFYPALLNISQTIGLNDSLIDIGSGGGFPGIPIALAYPHLRLVLCERTGKKSVFLNSAVTQFQLNVKVLAGDFKTKLHSRSNAISLKSNFDLATVRWVKLDIQLCRDIMSVLKPGGALIWYSSPSKDVINAHQRNMEIVKYRFAGDNRPERTLTLISRPK